MYTQLRLHQVGNTSSHKNTEVKQLGPQLALGWVTIEGLDVDAVVTNTVKSQIIKFLRGNVGPKK